MLILLCSDSSILIRYRGIFCSASIECCLIEYHDQVLVFPLLLLLICCSEALSPSVHAGLLVYIDIMKRQHKYDDALKLLQGLSGDLLTIDVDRLRLQVCFDRN